MDFLVDVFYSRSTNRSTSSTNRSPALCTRYRAGRSSWLRLLSSIDQMCDDELHWFIPGFLVCFLGVTDGITTIEQRFPNLLDKDPDDFKDDGKVGRTAPLEEAVDLEILCVLFNSFGATTNVEADCRLVLTIQCRSICHLHTLVDVILQRNLSTSFDILQMLVEASNKQGLFFPVRTASIRYCCHPDRTKKAMALRC